MYCAATAADCPFVAMSEKLTKMAANKQCGSEETSCPAGCCPEANWYCCPDNMYCAATASDCPFVAMSEKLTKMAANKQCGSDETSCPAGRCPEANWYCCPDNMYCAAAAADCPMEPLLPLLTDMLEPLLPLLTDMLEPLLLLPTTLLPTNLKKLSTACYFYKDRLPKVHLSEWSGVF